MSCNGMPSSFFPPNFILQMQTNPHEQEEQEHQLHSVLPQDFHGVPAMMVRRSMSFPGLVAACEDMVVNGEDELSDDGLPTTEKKRRLNMEQVRTLERNFELGNKLEPERKMQLARALGLQPRQVAIWFQNRRARWKTKQLEKDYDVLRKQFDAAKLENEELHALNRKLQSEIMSLKGGRETPEPINLNKETDHLSSSNKSDNSSTINLDISRTPPPAAATDAANPFNINSHRPLFQQFLQDAKSGEQHQGSAKLPAAVQQDESFCSMLSALDDQSGFWNVWPDQQSFH